MEKHSILSQRNPYLNFLRLAQWFADIRWKIDMSFLEEFDRAVWDLDMAIYAEFAWLDTIRGKLPDSLKKRYGDETPKNYDTIVNDFMESDTPSIRALRRIIYDSKIAFPLWYWDWLVDREDNIQSIMLWIHPQHEVMDYIQESLSSKNPEQFIALNYGAGNGQVMHDIHKAQSHSIIRSLWKMKRWNMVGLADKIYFPLSWVLESFYKGADIEVWAEIARFFMTQIQYDVQEHRFREWSASHPLQKDLRNLRIFLEQNPAVFSAKIKNGTYLADDEFDGDRNQIIPLTQKAQKLLKQYFKEPGKFIQQYFGDDFRGDAIVEQAPIFMRNIYIGDFSEVDQKFPVKEIFHYISSVRWTSHIDNEPYKKLIASSLVKLAPGWLMIDDGIRRSYTAEIRTKEVLEIFQDRELSKSIHAYIIRDALWNIISVLFEKGIFDKNTGIYMFRSADDIMKHVVLSENSIERIDSYASHEEFIKTLPIQSSVRDRVMRKLLISIERDAAYYPTISSMIDVVQYIQYTVDSTKEYTELDIDNITQKCLEIILPIQIKYKTKVLSILDTELP